MIFLILTVSASGAFSDKGGAASKPASAPTSSPTLSPVAANVKNPAGATETDEGWFAPIKPARELPALPEAVEKAIIIPIREVISTKTYKAIRRKVIQASRDNPELVIFDMDTYGGNAIAALEITRYIKTELGDVRTVCYVRTHAISAGAAIAMSCDEIIMTPAGKVRRLCSYKSSRKARRRQA